jgi:predicted dehydrogenase
LRVHSVLWFHYCPAEAEEGCVPTDHVRIGIVGAGFMGRVHADAARRCGARVVGVTASTPDRSIRAADDLGAELRFETAEAMVGSDEVDVVHVCTPAGSHASLVKQALAAGKHVVCEKPLATSAEEARQLTDAARDTGLVAAVPFVYRYHPLAWEAHEQVGSGRVGTVRLLHGSYLQDWLAGASDTDWRIDLLDGGPSRAFADVGSHWCDLAEWVSGHRITELSATVEITFPQRPAPTSVELTNPKARVDMMRVENEDIACLIFRTDRGAVGSLMVSQVSLGRKNRLWIEVDGSQGSLAFDQEKPEELWLGDRPRNQILLRDPKVLSLEAAGLATLPAGHSQGFADCFASFLTDVYNAIQGRRHRQFPTFDDASRSAQITEAVLASSLKRSWIDVSV